MTSFRARLLSCPVGLMLVSLFASAGCNFILNPANSDDVIRCKNTTECEKEAFFIEELRKERTDAACGAPGSGGGGFTTSKTNQVCSLVDKVSVSCGVEALPAGDFASAVDAAMMNSEVYAPCVGDKRGTLGCAPLGNGTCAAGLTVNDFGACDDGKGLPVMEPSDTLILQDVRDQHCRSYFCDETFVCNTQTSKCVRCNDDLGVDGLGQGACGDLVLSGARSTVYLSQDQLSEPSAPTPRSSTTTQFGPVVTWRPEPRLAHVAARMPTMLRILRNAEVYAPDRLGKRDLLIADRRIAAIAETLPKLPQASSTRRSTSAAALLTPGLIDAHVHLIGGGGESGPSTRVPPVHLSQLSTAGITTVVGVLGTDGTTRTVGDLVARTLGLREEGLSAYCYTGSYQVPVPTLTGSVRGDIVYIDPILGVGELALSRPPLVPADPRRAAADRLRRPRRRHDLRQGRHRAPAHGRRRPRPRPRPPRPRAQRDPGAGAPADPHQPQAQALRRGLRPRQPRRLPRRHRLPRGGGPRRHDVRRRGHRPLAARQRPARPTASPAPPTASAACPSSTATATSAPWTSAARPRCWRPSVKLLAERLPLERFLPVFTRNVAELLRWPHKGRIEVGADADLRRDVTDRHAGRSACTRYVAGERRATGGIRALREVKRLSPAKVEDFRIPRMDRAGRRRRGQRAGRGDPAPLPRGLGRLCRARRHHPHRLAACPRPARVTSASSATSAPHSADSIPFETRADAEREDMLDRLEQATCIFLTGGNQLQLSTILGGTPVARAIRRLNARGVTVGGTSAGAAILSEHMIAFGQGGATPIAGLASLAPGFGLTNRVVIDQHFRQRDRLGRLLSVLAFNPFAIGIGLDEDTAAFIDPYDVLHVEGVGAITIADVSRLEHSSMGHAKTGQAICLTGIQLHILTRHGSFNLHTRHAKPPPAPPDDPD